MCAKKKKKVRSKQSKRKKKSTQKALPIHKTYMGRLDMAIASLEEGDFSEAYVRLLFLMWEYPTKPRVFELLAECAKELEWSETTIFERLAKNPLDKDAFVDFGVSCYRVQGNTNVYKALKRAMELGEKGKETIVLCGDSLLMEQRYEEGLILLEEFPEEEWSFEMQKIYLRLLLGDDRLEEAEEFFSEVIEGSEQEDATTFGFELCTGGVSACKQLLERHKALGKIPQMVNEYYFINTGTPVLVHSKQSTGVFGPTQRQAETIGFYYDPAFSIEARYVKEACLKLKELFETFSIDVMRVVAMPTYDSIIVATVLANLFSVMREIYEEGSDTTNCLMVSCSSEAFSTHPEFRIKKENQFLFSLFHDRHAPLVYMPDIIGLTAIKHIPWWQNESDPLKVRANEVIDLAVEEGEEELIVTTNTFAGFSFGKKLKTRPLAKEFYQNLTPYWAALNLKPGEKRPLLVNKYIPLDKY